MSQFDPKFKDFPDYILGITREIWEDRGVGPALKRYYADDIIVRSPTGVQDSNASVTASTLQTIHEFPDRQLVGEDVIWEGSEEVGYTSSHRLTSVMRHTGSGAYGSATGALVTTRIIAECVVRNNQVVEEWLVRDQAAFARSLGREPYDLAKEHVEADLRTFGEVQYFTPDRDKAGPYVNLMDKGDTAKRYAGIWDRVWGEKDLSVIRDGYHTGCSVFAPGGETLIGHSRVDVWAVSYLSAFPDIAFVCDHMMVNRDAGYPERVAMRFTMTGTHRGYGRFGEPTGAPIHIMGLTQAYMVDGKILMEWVCLDEVAIWKQILDHQHRKTG